MRQFEVWPCRDGDRYLVVVDLSRWDFCFGFYRLVAVLPNQGVQHDLALAVDRAHCSTVARQEGTLAATLSKVHAE